MCLLENLEEIKKSLLKIALVLNDNGINWGLGGSLLLYLHGIETTVADIDIVIDEKDIDKVKKIINKFEHKEKQKNDIYLTEWFYSLNIDGKEIDIMVGFKIDTKNGIYSYPTGSKLVDKVITIDETNINLCSLIDWLDAYTAMKRESKITLIKENKQVRRCI